MMELIGPGMSLALVIGQGIAIVILAARLLALQRAHKHLRACNGRAIERIAVLEWREKASERLASRASHEGGAKRVAAEAPMPIQTMARTAMQPNGTVHFLGRHGGR